jgi:uncharacterized protein YjgD (DUF1641 family)
LGKVIDYFEYFKNHKSSMQVTTTTLAMVEQLYPKIEELLDNELARMTSNKDVYEALKNDDEIGSNLDLTVVTSLSFILSHYLKSLASRPNSFFVTEDTLEVFISNLIKGMLNMLGQK